MRVDRPPVGAIPPAASAAPAGEADTTVEIFVDYDGTITDGDTFDVLVRRFAGEAEWLRIEAALDAGTMSLREALEREASHVTLTLEEAEELLDREIAIDPSFGDFVRRCERAGVDVTVVSSGVEPVIARRLARNGIALPIVANGLDPSPAGWVLRFRDPVENGTDKAGIVRAARARGSRTVFIGDGRSDFEAMLEADHRFVKRGKTLERMLNARGVPFATFDDFRDVMTALIALV